MDLGVIVHGEGAAFIVRELFGYPGLVLLPAAVLQRCDVEEQVLPLGIKLCLLGRIEGVPAIPNLLEIRFVNAGSTGRLLRSRLLGLAETDYAKREHAHKHTPNAHLVKALHCSLLEFGWALSHKSPMSKPLGRARVFEAGMAGTVYSRQRPAASP